MRFVWQKRQANIEGAANPSGPVVLFRLAYNAAWLLPIILTYSGKMDYETGFVIFTAVCCGRFIANLYANNALSMEQYDRFLFRA